MKPKFNPATDLLLISVGDVAEAATFDEEGWLHSISDSVIVLSDDLKNIVIVRQGYTTGLF